MALVLDAILMPLGMYIAGGFLGIFADGGGAAGNVNQLPTLTLYGIAGLVLTIGMAVDANVLIFERIREEQKTGKRLVTAISSGFDKAFSTIFDANITTLLVAIILFVQGSGPIRGFAVMLTAGILVSMYTSLVFTRMGFDMIGKTSIEKVKMLSLLPDELNINFLSKDKIAMVLSAVLIIGSVGTIAVKGKDVLGIDFTGGTSIRYELTVPEGESQPSEEEIRDLLTLAGVRESVIQYQRTLIEGNADHQDKTLQVRVDSEFVDAVEQTLVSTYGDSMNLERIGFEDIGAQVGGEMRTQGIKAILYALLGIVIYITIRFEFAFAIGTIAALAHDVIITVGIYFMLGNQLSLPIVAALLTIVGYSANDTIVVFDRIREDLKLLKGKPYREIANISINQTFSRTLLTSLTTLFTIVMLLLFGGGAIFDFALALFIGVLVGTYSSTFVATPVMLLWHKEDKAA
jgi:SecD/SecF fusion protein